MTDWLLLHPFEVIVVCVALGLSLVVASLAMQPRRPAPRNPRVRVRRRWE